MSCSKHCGDRRSRLRSRLDVHEHICDAGVALLDRRLYSMRDLVAFMYGNVSVHSDVKIDVIIQAHLTRVTFFHFNNTRNRAGDGENRFDDFASRRGVHDLMERRE